MMAQSYHKNLSAIENKFNTMIQLRWENLDEKNLNLWFEAYHQLNKITMQMEVDNTRIYS